MSDDQAQNENEMAMAKLIELGIVPPLQVPTSAPVALIETTSEPRVHDLKVQTQFWADLWDFKTTAQLRQDDRKYRVGDVLLLREYNPEFGYTGMNCKRRITHILRHEDVPYGVRRGWCILSTAKMHEKPDHTTFRKGFVAGVKACEAEGFTNANFNILSDAGERAWAAFSVGNE